MNQATPDTWNDLAGNFAAVALIISIWAHATVHSEGVLRSQLRAVSIGLACGLAAAISISMAVPLAPGIIVDFRNGLIAGAVVAGGPIAGGVCFAIACVIRVLHGGAGVHDALAAMSMVLAVSFASHAIVGKRATVVRLVVSIATQLLVSTALFLTLPALTETDALARVGLPFIFLNTLAILLVTLVVEVVNANGRENRILRAALAQAPDFLYVKDLNSKFIAVNRNTAAHHKYTTPSAMIGLDDFALTCPPRAEELFEQERAIMRGNKPLLDHLEHLDGRMFLTSKVPLLDADGQVIGLAGVTRDMTEQAKLEAEVIEKGKQLTEALETMSDGFAMFDRSGTLLLCNDQYRSAFPLTGHLLVPGASVFEALRRALQLGELLDIGANDDDQAMNELTRAMSVDGVKELHVCDGRWHSMKLRWAGDRAIVIASDITAIKQSESTLRDAAEVMRHFAETDGLTGLANRRMFDLALSREFLPDTASQSPLSLMIIDVDHFKAYNDRYGHQAGDDCLRLIGKLLRETMKRSSDTVARYGGEEFVAILPQTDATAAMALAEKLMQRLRVEGIPHEGSGSGIVTVSIGLATTSRGPWSNLLEDQFVKYADAALYEAKRLGRDRACVWGRAWPMSNNCRS
ncbi:diguanylate cyclase [Rhizobium sp. G21]|uniref:diguanylate cyclase n=1 Tax=Rhizobium sp. G21 TaxID=2758439 RepID=UPI001603EEF2|nr:diguanylate cyclase [Rhizobium sp. G21]MBB1251715.1 diguanylate cyclase [Rhizobium sp. G21]